MLDILLDEINYPSGMIDTMDYIDSIASDGVVGTFSSDYYITGQYIHIFNTRLNDGVYKLTDVSATKLTIDGTLVDEDLIQQYYVFGLSIPNALITLAGKIETYEVSATPGLNSESQGNRSVSYGQSSSWVDVYRSELNKYRSLVDGRKGWLDSCGKQTYSLYNKAPR